MVAALSSMPPLLKVAGYDQDIIDPIHPYTSQPLGSPRVIQLRLWATKHPEGRYVPVGGARIHLNVVLFRYVYLIIHGIYTQTEVRALYLSLGTLNDL